MIEFVIIAVCVLLNAVLAAVEMAFVAVSRPALREMAKSGDKYAGRLLKLRENPERTLSVVQIGITIVGAIAAAVGGAGADELIKPYFLRMGLSPVLAGVLAIASIVAPIAYANVVIGELVPKTLALRNPLSLIMWAAPSLIVLDRTLAPIITVLEWSTKQILRFAVFRVAKNSQPLQAESTVEIGDLSAEHQQYVINLVGIKRKVVKEIMVPWSSVVWVSKNQSISFVENAVLSSGHTRLPVLEGENVVGAINTKEFIALIRGASYDWHAIIRDAVKVSPTDSLLKALRMMQQMRSHLSVVIADGKPIGIVTIEDIMEEVIGDIYDEDDDGAVRRILGRLALMRQGKSK